MAFFCLRSGTIYSNRHRNPPNHFVSSIVEDRTDTYRLPFSKKYINLEEKKEIYIQTFLVLETKMRKISRYYKSYFFLGFRYNNFLHFISTFLIKSHFLHINFLNWYYFVIHIMNGI